MTEKRFTGVKIICSGNLPVEIFNEKTEELEVFHMVQNGNTIYVSKELVEANKDYKRVEKDRDQLNDVVQHVWNALLDIDRDKLCFEKRRFFDELCNELGFDLSRIRMIEINTSIDSASDK